MGTARQRPRQPSRGLTSAAYSTLTRPLTGSRRKRRRPAPAGATTPSPRATTRWSLCPTSSHAFCWAWF